MLKAKDIMTAKCITLTPDTDIATAARVLLENKINGAPVIDEKGTVVGVLCQADLVAQQKKITLPSFFTLLDGVFPLSSHDELEREITKIAALKVAEAMTAAPTVIAPDTGIDDIATMMANKKLYTLPVLDNGRLVGVVGKEDVLKTLLKG
ncbi:MAG: CBS domain-containing protein [Pseudodesulfovibrio sp.]|uniref:CBS domain containing protein n=1 Tax=Pseudodesulfovibrio aespoeensis (strain ATCC 700646 / DSM 10631 / Aspo-2) TaxID=643562 RepID=E6VYJ0_PSEA9|nr:MULTISPECIES: CBS domain-containing protein [Pseudodesulfovibrio]MBU4193013.1 CBS domain-containing protein [Pseudomonadota bacterium]MCG2731722.1 CBS domain-containing protein [Pseudodesulfovibrio aespoeensis]ADU62753.1 CBS domain containing protein [Pseudodesulfovibrio aespoeensis Aspo-2]MBU4474196.1 CBS domain-containing protein [Pseudomonadota bacterium]MBU4515690.1 CBS domain-containing protein [Pseudomonadota bacterium]